MLELCKRNHVSILLELSYNSNNNSRRRKNHDCTTYSRNRDVIYIVSTWRSNFNLYESTYSNVNASHDRLFNTNLDGSIPGKYFRIVNITSTGGFINRTIDYSHGNINAAKRFKETMAGSRYFFKRFNRSIGFSLINCSFSLRF